MGTLTALALATPLFGFALTPPDMALAPQLLDAATSSGSLAVDVGDAEAGAARGPTNGASADEEEESTQDPKAYAAQLRERAELAEIHRPLGIATYAAMGITLVLGGIQYHNLYGLFASQDDNPCVTGDAIFGQGQCSGTPFLHLGAALVTTGLYSATFAVSLLMPDPDDADEGDSEYAENLRMHKLLRWVHFGGMIAQAGLGFMIANGEVFGMDRANDYGTLQALSTVHMGLGLVTFGAMTWAMILML